MHASRAHALAALVGASAVGCVDGEKGARPTSSASYSDGEDSSVYDPFESTTGGDTTGGSVGDPDPSAPVSTQGGTTGSDSTSGTGMGGPSTTGAEDSGTSSGTASTGYTTGGYTTGYYGTYGYAPEEDDAWFLGLREVECGDVPLRSCP